MLLVQEDIQRLEVAVQHLAAMHVVEPQQHLHACRTTQHRDVSTINSSVWVTDWREGWCSDVIQSQPAASAACLVVVHTSKHVLAPAAHNLCPR